MPSRNSQLRFGCRKAVLEPKESALWGSVVAADEDHYTVAADYDDDKDYNGLGLLRGRSSTWTLASTLLEYSTSDFLIRPGTSEPATAGDIYAYSMKCEMQTAAMEADCTYSIGTGLARARCNPPASPTSFVLTNLWTFTDTDTAGVETILRTYVNSPTAPVPTWCADENAPIPTSDLITSVKIPRSEYGTYELVITAGEEKLRATTGGSVSTSGPQPTGMGSEAVSGATSSEAAATGGAGDTGAATSVRGAAPAVAGLGAAIAAYFL